MIKYIVKAIASKSDYGSFEDSIEQIIETEEFETDHTLKGILWDRIDPSYVRMNLISIGVIYD